MILMFLEMILMFNDPSRFHEKYLAIILSCPLGATDYLNGGEIALKSLQCVGLCK